MNSQINSQIKALNDKLQNLDLFLLNQKIECVYNFFEQNPKIIPLTIDIREVKNI